MRIVMKTELSLYVDGSKIICEQHGDIKNAKKILLFCHGFIVSNSAWLLVKIKRLHTEN